MALSAQRLDGEAKAGSTTGPISYPVAASTTVYAGGLYMLDETGFLAVPADLTNNQGCVGIADETVENSGADGALSAKVRKGIFLMKASSATQAWVGHLLHATDDETVALAPGNDEPKAGRCVGFKSATEVWVDVGNFDAP